MEELVAQLETDVFIFEKTISGLADFASLTALIEQLESDSATLDTDIMFNALTVTSKEASLVTLDTAVSAAGTSIDTVSIAITDLADGEVKKNTDDLT